MTSLDADDDRADRAAEALAQAERDRVRRTGQVARRDAGRALGDDRVPEPGAIDVEGDAVVVGRSPATSRRYAGRERLAHRVGVGVLEGDECR